MDDDALNMTVRRFLKEFGVSGHQAVDRAVRAAVADGRLSGGDEIAVSATLTIEALGVRHTVDGKLTAPDA